MPKNVTDMSQKDFLMKNCLAQIDDLSTLCHEKFDTTPSPSVQFCNLASQQNQKLSIANMCHNTVPIPPTPTISPEPRVSAPLETLHQFISKNKMKILEMCVTTCQNECRMHKESLKLSMRNLSKVARFTWN